MGLAMITAQTAVIDELYNILGLFVPIGLLLACGLMFFFITIPNNPLLSNYRKMRYVMAFAYLLFIPCLTAEYLFRDMSGNDLGVQQVIYLTLSSSQAFLFTLTFLALLEVKPQKWQAVLRMAFPILLFVALVLTVYFSCSKTCFEVTFYLFFGAYAFLLVYYTRLFITTYKGFRFRMDNYFSDCKVEQLRWIKDSFYLALTVGTAALIITLFLSIWVLLIFSISFVTFYLYFAFRFVNYAYRFNIIKQTMEGSSTKKGIALQPDPPPTNHRTGTDSVNFSALEKRIEQWIKEKSFVQQGITMDTLAYKFYTNRSYLSNYINLYKQKTFREWINCLRVEEAKKLLREYPEKTIAEIAAEVGIPDTTCFRRHFVSLTGLSPKIWRNNNDD